MSEYVGVILAGGRGSRMGVLGDGYPKALLPLANEPLVAHHLRLLSGMGIRRVHILVGHRSGDLIAALGDGAAWGVSITYVEQGHYLGSAHALGRVRSLVRVPFVLLLGDYYCSLSDPGRMIDRLDAGDSAIAAKREPDSHLLAEACELQVAPDHRLLAIVEKPVRPAGDLKGCGVYALQPDIFDAVGRTPRSALRDEYELTHALQLHIEAGRAIYAEDIVVWDRNFTRPEDVLESNLQWLDRTGRKTLIAEEARIDEDVRIERTVVGNHARITRGSRLKDVVVFAGASPPDGGSVSRALVTRDGLYRFGMPGAVTSAQAPATGEPQLAGKETT